MKYQYRITVAKLAFEHGYENVEDFLEERCIDSIMPACCNEGCEIEPDGFCEHGCPSPLIALGLI